ncbi:MAG TPA: extracellular solute-binding protein [Casimicrobiaceae bacterium]|jgi:ABC-type glycerol-3-phosphate transport system substrate-binding protein
MRFGWRKSLLFACVTALQVFASAAAQAQAKELTMWTFLATQGTDPRSTALRNVVERFNKSQGNYTVKVESINFARIDNVVIQSTAAGQGPDILNVYTDQLPMHVAAKTVQPLDAFYAKLPAAAQKDFVMDLDFLRYDGKLMALPWETRVWLLWYRKDLLDKAGAQPPRTTEELAQTAAKISTDQVMGFGFGASTGALGAGAMEAFVPLFWGAGGQLFDAKGNATINSDAGVRTLSYFRDLVTKTKGMRGSVAAMSVEDALTAVRAGTIGMTLMGSFRVGAARNAAATGNNLQTAPVPGWTADKPSPARVAGQTLAIGANTKEPAGAWAFIQHYLSPASQLEFAKAGVMPSRISSYEEKFFKDDPAAKDMQQWTDYAKRFGRMEKTPKDFSKLSEELAKAIQKVIVQGVEPKTALDEAAAAYNAQRS